MATFHENLKQSFKNFKNKYIGNVPSGVTLAQINASLPDTKCDLLVSIPNAQSYTSVTLNTDKKFSDYKFVGFIVVNKSNQNMLTAILPLSFFKLFNGYATNRFAFPLISSTDNLTGQYDDDTHVIARCSLANTSVSVYGINP